MKIAIYTSLLVIMACGSSADDIEVPDDGTCIGPESYSLTFEQIDGDCPAMRNRSYTNQQDKIPFVVTDTDCEQSFTCHDGYLHLDVHCQLSSHVVPGETVSIVDFNVPNGNGTVVVNVNQDRDYDPRYVCSGTYNATIE